MDNTWSTFLGCNPLEIGVDIVVESLTKYFSGHSDNFLGLIVLNSAELARKIKTASVRLGDYVSPESCFNATKGLKTLKLRIEKHIENADKIFNYLKSKRIVKKILYLPDQNNKFHELWKKYHKQSNGLITFSIQKKKNVDLFIDQLELFKIGFSWGGYESLIIPLSNLKPTKKLSKKREYWFRIHVGLESCSDLINDLEKAFKNYEK
jgi:cystathionine beta-lyase